MKKEMFYIGLAIFSLAGTVTLAQNADESASASATAETETDTTTIEENGRKDRKVRIERRLPGGAVEVEEYSNDLSSSRKPTIRRRVQVFHNDDAATEDIYQDRRIDVRPQIRVFPRERELVVRRSPNKREIRVDLDLDDPVILGTDADNADAPIEHLEQAIRHLKKAKMRDAAARLEADLAKLRTRRGTDTEHLRDELDSLRKERDILKEQLEELRRTLDELKAGNQPKQKAEDSE